MQSSKGSLTWNFTANFSILRASQKDSGKDVTAIPPVKWGHPALLQCQCAVSWSVPAGNLGKPNIKVNMCVWPWDVIKQPIGLLFRLDCLSADPKLLESIELFTFPPFCNSDGWQGPRMTSEKRANQWPLFPSLWILWDRKLPATFFFAFLILALTIFIAAKWVFYELNTPSEPVIVRIWCGTCDGMRFTFMLQC